MARNMTPDGRVTQDFTAPVATNEKGWVVVGDGFIPRENLALCHFFGSDYPGPRETYDYSMSKGQVGAGLAVGTDIFDETKLIAGASSYVQSPWSVQDIAGPDGFSIVAVGEFVAIGSALISTFAASELPGFSLYRSAADSSYRIQTYQSGTDYQASLATTAYSGDGMPETLFADVTDTILRIWHKQPGHDWRKTTAANSIPVASLGSNQIRFGRSRGSSQNAACNVLHGSMRNAPFVYDSAVEAYFARLQPFMAAKVGVTI